MLSDQPPCVLAVGTGLGAKTRSIGNKIFGQLLRGKDFLLVEIGYRNLGRGDQKIVPSFQLE